MTRKFNLLLYAFVSVCVIRIGLSICSRYLMTDIIEVHHNFELIEGEVEGFRHFDDSLAGNENFKKRILDTIRDRDHLRQVKQNLGRQLEQKIIDLDKQYPNRQEMLTWFRIFDGLKTLTNILFVVLGLPIFIHLIRVR